MCRRAELRHEEGAERGSGKKSEKAVGEEKKVKGSGTKMGRGGHRQAWEEWCVAVSQ